MSETVAVESSVDAGEDSSAAQRTRLPAGVEPAQPHLDGMRERDHVLPHPTDHVRREQQAQAWVDKNYSL